MLSDRLAERSSAVEWLRLFAASIVVLYHCFALNGLWGQDPVARMLPGTDTGLLGVQVFFFLSGLLVAQSYVNHRSPLTFAIARVLRVYPVLVAATLFTIAVGAWSTALDLRTFLAHPDTLSYAIHRSLGLVAVDQLPGAFVHNPYPVAVNGSLWTLPIEIKMYVGVAIAGVLGLMTRKWALTGVLCACIALFVAVPATYPIEPDFRGPRIFTLMFALGVLCFAWRQRIPLSILAAVGCALSLALLPIARTQAIVYSVLVGYVVLTLAYHPLLQNRLPRLRADLSYGIYVYSFPIQQTLIERWGSHFVGHPWMLLPVAMLIVVPIAALSWFALEKPALALKRH